MGGVVHCKRCMVPRAGRYLPGQHEKAQECIRGEELPADDAPMCHSMRADIAEAALMRLACPSAFDENNKIIGEKWFEANAAMWSEMRKAMSVRGPTLVFEQPQPAKAPETP